MFLRVRATAHRYFADIVRESGENLDEASVQLLTTYAIAAADGLFIAKEVGGDSVDLLRLFELHATAALTAAAQLRAGITGSGRSGPRTAGEARR